MRIAGETGVIYNLLADRWQLSADMDVFNLGGSPLRRSRLGGWLVAVLDPFDRVRGEFVMLMR